MLDGCWMDGWMLNGWLEKAELKPTQPSLAGVWLSLVKAGTELCQAQSKLIQIGRVIGKQECKTFHRGVIC